jgi:hypothetical protein
VGRILSNVCPVALLINVGVANSLGLFASACVIGSNVFFSLSMRLGFFWLLSIFVAGTGTADAAGAGPRSIVRKRRTVSPAADHKAPPDASRFLTAARKCVDAQSWQDHGSLRSRNRPSSLSTFSRKAIGWVSPSRAS